MNAFIPTLPEGPALVVFVICLALGAFVIIKYCVDQFDKPIEAADAPWKFVVPSLLTSRQQYLAGFALYCGAIMLIFLIVSVVIGPANFYFIMKAISAALSQTDLPEPELLKSGSLEAYPAFPIVVAFYIIGLNPNLPKMLNFEEPLRRLAHRVAYIPKHMMRILNYMRFSQFDLSGDRVAKAYAAVELRRPTDDLDELKPILPLLDRLVVLYADAATLAGDLTYAGAADLQRQLDLDVFKQYRVEIQNVGTNLQGIGLRLTELANLNPTDRQKVLRMAQRDLSRSLETLYVIFACASTVQDTGRIADRLRATGFHSAFPRDEIPWDPILRAIGAAALVMFVAFELATFSWLGEPVRGVVPPTIGGILILLATILFVHAAAIGLTLNVRARLIASDRYYSATGRGNLVSYANILVRCWVTSLLWYLLLNLPNLAAAITTVPPAPQLPPKSTQALMEYLRSNAVWALVPAWCGAMTAYVIDRPLGTLVDRMVSTAIMGVTLAAAAVVAVQIAWGPSVPVPIQIFYLVLYGGLGTVLGFVLPAALHRYWRALEEQLPDQIGLLRANVMPYFHDVQQFSEWLNTANERLDNRRPLDVLTEDGGLQRLTQFVTTTRPVMAHGS